MTVFLSEAIGAARLPFGRHAPESSARLRRWQALAALYRGSFARCGHETRSLLRPEIYQTAVARQACGFAPGDWHFAVKPLEHLRPFHGVPNAFLCDWGFPTLCERGGPGAPFLNHRRVLATASVVACTSEETAASLRRAGIPRVQSMPPIMEPDPARAAPSPAREGEWTGCTILATLDAEDPADLWTALLCGFAAAFDQDARLRLVIAIDGGPSLDGLRREALARIGDAAAAAITWRAAAPAESILALTGKADLYLSVAPVGGLAVPVVQAMASGWTVLAPCHAWLSAPAQTFVPVATAPRSVSVAEEPAASLMTLQNEAPTPLSISAAILEAAARPVSARRAMGERARRFVADHFGQTAFESAWAAMVAHPAASP